jgi:hypothetical protein
MAQTVHLLDFQRLSFMAGERSFVFTGSPSLCVFFGTSANPHNMIVEFNQIRPRSHSCRSATSGSTCIARRAGM